ncbi:hypothetical protein G7045_03985 [Acidovorax sp. HDW3]|uniref:hypothetical protein n=1 Tax=Acidovorax sp. HDW3 TaxID=2714923 RepID=UPI00140C6B9C|nr:hypothetical protein [Acidovorax sp. HDW3]QIL43496.1 hypothetical protein G7045_03985 [Acidovorax sp. HDW3]
MKKLLFVLAGIAGLITLGWLAWGYRSGQPLALGVTLAITGFYLGGVVELLRTQRANAALQQALRGLTAAPAQLADWLVLLPEGLRPLLQQRLAGSPARLPAPQLAPYLSGLLVLLGMLGTFAGMVVALQGTGTALEGAQGLAAMREALSAPVRGLGLAFGTSVAGVAGSAMLGLMTALVRRDSQRTAQQLDAALAGPLQAFGARQQRAQQWQAQQQAQQQMQQQWQEAQQRWQAEQAQLLPALVARLEGAMAQSERQQQAAQQQLQQAQERFYRQQHEAFAQLALQLQQGLAQASVHSLQQASAQLQPIVTATLDGLAQTSTALQRSLGAQLQQQLDALGQQWASAQAAQQQAAAEHSAQHHGAAAQLLQSLAAHTHSLATQLADDNRTHSQAQAAQWQALLAQHAAQGQVQAAAQASAWQAAQQEHQAQQGRQAQDLLQTLQLHTQAQQALQRDLIEHFERAGHTLGSALQAQLQSQLAEVAQLLQAAGEAPRAAAAALAALQQQRTQTQARDDALLAERERLLAALQAQWQAAQDQGAQQQQAIDALVAAAAGHMAQAERSLTAQQQAQAERLDGALAQLQAGAIELSSLGDVLGAAVERFGDANAQTLAQLAQLQTALGQSLARSDEQLDYYVAQAREVVELSVGAQKDIIDALQALAAARAGAPA